MNSRVQSYLIFPHICLESSDDKALFSLPLKKKEKKEKKEIRKHCQQKEQQKRHKERLVSFKNSFSEKTPRLHARKKSTHSTVPKDKDGIPFKRKNNSFRRRSKNSRLVGQPSLGRIKTTPAIQRPRKLRGSRTSRAIEHVRRPLKNISRQTTS